MAENPNRPRQNRERAERAGPAGPSESEAHAKERSRDDPEVRAWVSRFADPQGPPRIGSRAGMEDSVFLSIEPSDSEIEAASAPAGVDAPPAEVDAPAAATAPKRPRLATRRGKPERVSHRSRSRSGQRLTAAAV